MTAENNIALLKRIFDADRTLRDAEVALLSGKDTQGVAASLRQAAETAKSLDDPVESSLRLSRLADLCSQVPGPLMADTLIDILDHDNPAVRVAAGEALLDVGYERYAEVARAIERLFADGAGSRAEGPAMCELPFILAEIAEPSALPLIRRFLDHEEADVVAASIEALVELGDSAALVSLKPLKGDGRRVQLDDAEGVETDATIGELATEACESLVGGDD